MIGVFHSFDGALKSYEGVHEDPPEQVLVDGRQYELTAVSAASVNGEAILVGYYEETELSITMWERAIRPVVVDDSYTTMGES